MKVYEKIKIAELVTMRIGGVARYVIEATTVEELQSALDFATQQDLPIWLMGEGANTIGKDTGFNGVIIINKLTGIEILAEDDATVTVQGMAGENWDRFVEFTTARGWSGLELLSKIPGSLGAAPVQNIGAYGSEVADVLEDVMALDTKTREIITIPKDAMNMGYRKTRFNYGKDKGRFIIVAVTIKLIKKQTLKPPFYNSLQLYLDKVGATDYSPQTIRRAVSELRAQKLPDPRFVASSGSFFKNVLLDPAKVADAKAKEIPVWVNSDGSGKVNAGWLIEACGLKGEELFGFRVSEKAALVLINESATSYAELDQARNTIIEKVKDRFGYVLEQEPVEITE